MYSRINDPSEGRATYSIPGEDYGDYATAQETGIGEPKVFIDNSQHITNYTVNVNLTGDKATDFQRGSGATMPTYVLESDFSNKLLGLLDEIEDLSDAPAAFEQKLSTFLSVLDKLDERRMEREVYFSDLVSMLRMSLVSVECVELSSDGIAALREAVGSLARRITEQRFRELRNALRESGVDILKPFKSELDTKSVLREIFGDETTA